MVEKKGKRISVRLYEESNKKCEEARRAGYSTSEFINTAILRSQVQPRLNSREILKCVCQIETFVECLKDKEIRNLIREELKEICQYLK